MKKMLIANWKMNLGCKAGYVLAHKFTNILKKSSKKDYIILPSSQSIYYIKKKVQSKLLNLGAQDCSQFSSGAYTGDISASMIKELGCKYVLLGHSERRSIHYEDKNVLKEKLKHAISNRLKIIFCIGEKLPDYKNSNTKKVINFQLSGISQLISLIIKFLQIINLQYQAEFTQEKDN